MLVLYTCYEVQIFYKFVHIKNCICNVAVYTLKKYFPTTFVVETYYLGNILKINNHAPKQVMSSVHITVV